MINARKILRNIRGLSQSERISLHSGRKSYLLNDEDFGNIPRNIMFICVRMYIEQQCENGFKSFALWLHDVYENGSTGTQIMIGKTLDCMDSHKVSQVDSYAVEKLLKRKPKNISIDIEGLISDLDNIYDLDGQRDMDYEETTIEQWINVIALGRAVVIPASELQAEGDFTGYEEITVTYAAAEALNKAGAMHYIDGEKVNAGMIKVAVDNRFLSQNFSGEYEKITAPYADVKKWNNANPPELWCSFNSYDAETGLCEAMKPVECNIKTDDKYNTAYSYKRQQRQRGRRDITPPVINVEDLNVEVPECLLN